MGMSRRIQTMRPLTQGKGTRHQRTNQQALMAMEVILTPVIIVQVDRTKSLSLLATSTPREQQNCSSLSPISLEQW
jgi:hypothetical protein